ncbi:MAG: DUF2304 domain-containing protein [Oscillospiraceae bacterium]|nr:DUF2304 domain-containing protein [Oscillospiraceae bacterium]MBP1571301.1 DUF2304 domain-containing protein [Oscillospiraceae bacterium]MBQ5313397.1 DUF2304 domain-containing protein [Oscillospiraceae bacterium]MBQ5324785.1 DUF2304 domain-containing protein [Oscillospiraceae bacterium]
MKPMVFSLRVVLLLGSVGMFAFILYLIKKGKLEIKYSIIWMAFSAAMLMFAIFPYFVLILGDIAGVLDPVNFIFLSQIVFILLILLSVSAVISGFSQKIKKLAQANAFLEKRVRELEESIENNK